MDTRHTLIVIASSLVAVGSRRIMPGEAAELEITRQQAEHLMASGHRVMTPEQHAELRRLRAEMAMMRERADALLAAGLPDEMPASTPGDELDDLRRAALRDLCREYGLKVGGTVNELKRRIRDHRGQA